MAGNVIRKTDIRDEDGNAFSSSNPLHVEAGDNGVNTNLRDNAGTAFSVGNPLNVVDIPLGTIQANALTKLTDIETAIDEVKANQDAIPKTAFGEQIAARRSPIFQGTFEYTVDNTELTSNTVAGSGSVTQATGMALVGTGTTTGSTAKLRTVRPARYRSGLGGDNPFTSLFTSPVAGTDQLIGLADEAGSSQPFKNGYMIGYIGTVFGFHRFQNDTVTTTPLASWDDPLDGNGSSGMTIDLTKLNVWKIQFQYLGGGEIQVMVENPSTGKFFVALRVQYANLNTSPSVYNPNFYFTIWVNNKATTSDIVLKCASYAFFVQGETELVETHQPQFSSGEQTKGTITTEVPIFTIRNKSQYVSKTNFIDILLEVFSASIEAAAANNLGRVRLIKNATLGGTPSWSDINTANSISEIDTAATSFSGGKGLISLPLAGKNDRVFFDVTRLKILLAPGDSVTLVGQSANSATINGSLLWKELF